MRGRANTPCSRNTPRVRPRHMGRAQVERESLDTFGLPPNGDDVKSEGSRPYGECSEVRPCKKSICRTDVMRLTQHTTNATLANNKGHLDDI